MDLKTLRTLLIDGDGVLWEAESPMPSIQTFFKVLAERGIQWGLLTNNASRNVAYYVDKLAGFGVRSDPSQIFTSAVIAADYLRDTYPSGSPIYVIGEEGLQEAVAHAGFEMHTGELQPAEARAVVAGIDRALTYDKLKVATHLIRYRNAAFIGTNPDPTYPSPGGLVPGAGSIIAALKTSTGQEPLIVGKPSPTIFRIGMKELGGDPATTAMLGDRLDTDIAGAKPLGIGTILVLSGVTSRAEAAASAIHPDLIYDGIAALAGDLVKVTA